MRFGTIDCIRNLPFVLAICLLTGCWQEIEYRGPDPPTAKSSAPPLSPAAVPAEPTEPAPTTAEVGDRYANTVDSKPAAPPAAPIEPPINEAEAIPVSAVVDIEPPQPTINTRRAAWLLGSRLSVAALANDRGIAAENVPMWYQEARSMADALQVPLDELPQRPATPLTDGASREALAYLIDQGKTINGELETSRDAEHAALFQMAWTSNLLLVINQPESADMVKITKLITGAAQRTTLPPKLWQPLLDTLSNGSPPAAVRTAVRQMHDDVEGHLAAPVEQ